MKLTRLIAMGTLAVSSWAGNALAVDTDNPPFRADFQPVQSAFEKGKWEATLNSGAMFSPFIATVNRPVVDYTMTSLQLGRMMTEPSGDLLRGNFEAAGEIFGGGIFDGRGNYLSGFTLWGRYNFLPENWRVVPYAQAGLGALLTDVDRRLQGQNFNFNLELGLGLRYMINDHWSANAEYRFQHISNADMSSKNVGVNADGFMVGVSYFF